MNKLYVVGLGPGGPEGMTQQAREAIEGSDLLVGYTVYIDLIRAHFPDKPILTTPMRREVERVELALQEAAAGKTVAMVCSGDPGVYGMAGLCLELGEKYPKVSIEIVPGVTALLSGAALLGAPLMHDFVAISLSDLLTSWEAIEARLRAAAQGDFVICLYNPASHKRRDHLRRACDILLETKAPGTPCGIAQNIGREGQMTQYMPLFALREAETDMFSTVFIGNSQTKMIGGRMVTPREYAHD